MFFGEFGSFDFTSFFLYSFSFSQVHPLKADIMGHLQREDNRPIRDIDPLILLVMEVILPLVHLEVTNIPLNLREVIPQVHRHQGQEVTPQVEVHHLPNNKSLVLHLLRDLRLQLQLQILRTVDLLPTQVLLFSQTFILQRIIT